MNCCKKVEKEEEACFLFFERTRGCVGTVVLEVMLRRAKAVGNGLIYRWIDGPNCGYSK
jgi:hypothetical protein